MRLLAIDPGPEQSAYVLYDTDRRLPYLWDKLPNESMRGILNIQEADLFAVEMVASYGKSVGQEVFSTCVWAGRFIERWEQRNRPATIELFRREVKLHLCESVRANDSNIRAALIDKFGPGKERAIGLKKSPGPLYGIKSDVWAALAVAVTASETRA